MEAIFDKATNDYLPLSVHADLEAWRKAVLGGKNAYDEAATTILIGNSDNLLKITGMVRNIMINSYVFIVYIKYLCKFLFSI